MDTLRILIRKRNSPDLKFRDIVRGLIRSTIRTLRAAT
jgi:hypothetical protein